VNEKIIFLDRDGVINKDPEDKKYVTSIEEFKFIPGSIEAIRRLSVAGYKIFVISNQQGVGKGLYTQKTLDDITNWMSERIKERGARIEKVYYCTHTEVENCSCRKPKTGLIRKALDGLRRDLNKTFFIGDTQRDLKTGKAAGCKTILVLSGKTKDTKIGDWQVKPDYIFNDLKDAVDFILTPSFLRPIMYFLHFRRLREYKTKRLI
jgi:histidinol-phosphate phosphatase family protein